MKEIHISAKEEGQRLDKILGKYLDQAAPSFLYKMLRKKNIKLNGKKADGREKVKDGDVVTLFLADETIEKFQKNQPASDSSIKKASEAMAAKGVLHSWRGFQFHRCVLAHNNLQPM